MENNEVRNENENVSLDCLVEICVARSVIMNKFESLKEYYESLIEKLNKLDQININVIYVGDDYFLAMIESGAVNMIHLRGAIIKISSLMNVSVKSPSILVLKSFSSNEIESINEQDALTKKLDSLINVEQLKNHVNDIQNIYPILCKHNAVKSIKANSYLISINAGFGLTSYLQVLGALYNKLDIYCLGEPLELTVAPSNEKEDKLKELSERVSRLPESVICIDISEYIEKVYTNSMRLLLQEITKNNENRLFVFRVPYLEKNVINNINKGLSDILNVTTLIFPPFDNNTTQQLASKILNKYGYELDDSSRLLFMNKIIEEKNDGRYYGMNTIEKVVNQMIYLKCRKEELDKDCEKYEIITADDLQGLIEESLDNEKDGLDELSNLVGMESVKKQILEIIAQIKASIRFNPKEKACIHMRFVGAPGTGKTTVARIIGKILKEAGVLTIGCFYEVSGRDLVGKYIGHTAPKTNEICRDAYGSVLFIDEAYSLYHGNDTGRDFGVEAVDTLIAQLENHRSDMVVIFAGYQKEMDVLMESNPGLASRVPYEIVFPNYNRETLFKIFMSMVEKSKVPYSNDFEEEVKDYFMGLSSDIVDAPNFGNARYVRNVYERVIGKAITRCDLLNISVAFEIEDIKAISEIEMYHTTYKRMNKLGF